MPGNIGLLFIGDLIGRPGRQALARFLPRLKAKYRPTLVVANGENAAGGSGITEDIGRDLFTEVDVLTSGNHVWDRKEAISYLDKEPRLLRPANYPAPNPGRGAILTTDSEGRKIGVLNLQGRVFMEAIDCPFRSADAEVARLGLETQAIVIDFHAEATSEKQALGWYLDGRVSAVLGTHTHVATADERVLPGGTAFITDVGMAGARDSVIGIRREQSIEKFLTARPIRFEPEKGRLALAAVFVEIDPETGRAVAITREMITGTEDDGDE
jgi:2',3'-cyclic-nucleotide 2'-phosphodiesterase